MKNKRAIEDILELPVVEIPDALANLMLPAPDLVTYYKNLEFRTLWLDTEVTVDWLEVERQIILWNREDRNTPVEVRRPIRLMIYSYGGDLEVNNSLINLIKISKTPVIGVNMGQANSAGCYIFMSCHKRYAMPNAQFLIHQGSASGMKGTYGQMNAYMRDYTRKMDALKEYIIAHTKIAPEVLEDKLSGEWFVTAEEAVELGICDKIVTDIDDLFVWE